MLRTSSRFPFAQSKDPKDIHYGYLSETGFRTEWAVVNLRALRGLLSYNLVIIIQFHLFNWAKINILMNTLCLRLVSLTSVSIRMCVFLSVCVFVYIWLNMCQPEEVVSPVSCLSLHFSQCFFWLVYWGIVRHCTVFLQSYLQQRVLGKALTYSVCVCVEVRVRGYIMIEYIIGLI